MKHRILIFFLVLSIPGTYYSCKTKTSSSAGRKTDSTSVNLPDSAKAKKIWSEHFKFAVYHNARYDYCIWYPSVLMKGLGESDNGDGQEFVSNDMKLRMIVSGEMNIENLGIRDIYQKDYEYYSSRKDYKITTGVVKTNYYVIGGLKGGISFYSKTFLRGKKIISVYFEYSPEDSVIYDKIMDEILRRFPSCPDKS